MSNPATTTEVNTDNMAASAPPPKTKFPFKLINEHQRSSKSKTADEELLMEVGTFCIKLTESPKPCYKKSCLLCLAANSIRDPVTSYLIQFAKKSVSNRGQTLVDWVRSARANHPHKSTIFLFNLPFDATNCTAEANYHLHEQDRICKVALM